ncbi:MAG: glycosyltransferase family 4 protein, partial [Nitrospinae bacterium]|nr:glycosyltransferase family 4 protein [Nitrospinota bacterium]
EIYDEVRDLKIRGVEVVRLYEKRGQMEAFRRLYKRESGVRGTHPVDESQESGVGINPESKIENRRIAVVDSFFSWPPTGGSAVDLMGLMNGLTDRGFEVIFFLPLIEDDLFFPAGLVNANGEIKFNVVQIPINLSQYNKFDFPKIISEAVDSYKPEFLFLGDMYSFKPYVAERLNRYKTIWRFYAYGLICPRCTHLDKDLKVCENTYFKNKGLCERCIKNKLYTNGDEPIYRELRESDIFSDGYEAILKKGLDNAHSLIVYNDYQREILSKSVKNRNIAVIPTGISSPHTLHSEGGESGWITILMCGRISDLAKGFSILHEAFHILKERHKNIRLLITSKFDFTEDGIESAGWVHFNEIYKLYESSDICVIPSLWEEPFGIVALEAMASGRPVVASRAGGLKDIVVDGETGYLVESGDVKGLTDRLDILIENKSLRTEMGMKGIERAKEYAWDRVIDKYKHIFKF